jgi:hypothetical protein
MQVLRSQRASLLMRRGRDFLSSWLCFLCSVIAPFPEGGASEHRNASLDHASDYKRGIRIAPPGIGWRGPARPRWCDQIPTPAENQLYPYSEHSCAHCHSHDFGKLFGDWGVKSPRTGVVMSIIPLDVQRRCERRWAARFSRPTESVAPKRIDVKRPVHNLPRIAKAKEKPAGLSRRV